MNKTENELKPCNEISDELIREVKRRTSLFVTDNYQNLTPLESEAVHLIIEQAMLIGGSIILEQDARRAVPEPETQTVILGFTSWQDGRFELIVRDRESHEETVLCGQLESGQLEIVSKILPTCVFVNASLPEPEKDTNADEFIRNHHNPIVASLNKRILELEASLALE